MAKLRICDRCDKRVDSYTTVKMDNGGTRSEVDATMAIAHTRELCETCASQLREFLTPVPHVSSPRVGRE